jgi:hypothetical protein
MLKEPTSLTGNGRIHRPGQRLGFRISRTGVNGGRPTPANPYLTEPKNERMNDDKLTVKALILTHL